MSNSFTRVALFMRRSPLACHARPLAAIRSGCLPWALVASAHAAPQTFVVTDEAGQAVDGAAVAVFVKGARATAPAGTTADMAQKARQFVPALLVVQTGTSVNFPNVDTVRHHVYSFSPLKNFEIKLYAGTPSAPVVFDKPGTATIGCNIHDRMRGNIHVVDTPYFGATTANGQVTIEVPAGEHRVRVWHPTLGENATGPEQAFKSSTSTVAVRLKH